MKPVGAGWRRAALHVARRLCDRRAAAIVEFAIIIPVMMVMMMGMGDMLYQLYAKALLNGSIQKSGRDSSIQGGASQATTLDNRVRTAVTQVAKNATFTVTRLNYDNFSVIGPEKFDDANANGVRDPRECFTDVNRNGLWDPDPGVAGQGGANDVTAYEITVTYPRLFPVARLLGWGANATITAQTVLKNQPYENQTVLTPQAVCT